MPLWGNQNIKAKAPKYKVIEAQVTAGSSKGNNNAFNNTSAGVFKPNQVLGVWGANASQMTGANSGKISHTGWHLVRQGTGPVTTLVATVGGTGFANLSVATVTSPQAGGNAQFSATTNSTSCPP